MKDAKIISQGILRALAITVGILVLCLFLYAIRSVLLYISFAAVVALIGRPVVYFLRHRLRIPNQLAVIITLFSFFLIIVGILALFIPIISQQSENLGRINYAALKNNVTSLIHQIQDYLGLKPTNLLEEFNPKNLLSYFNFESIPLFMGSIFGTVGSLFIGVFAILFISFFFLKDSNLLFKSFLAFSKKGNEERFERIFTKIKNLLSRYFAGIALQIFVLFVLYAILLYIFDIQNPVAIAFICAFLNIVPYVGPIIAGVLMVFFTATTNLGSDFSSTILPTTLYVLVGYLIIQLLDNIINQPLIFSQSVKSHPLEIFLVIIIASLIFGIFGMIVAVPSYTALKVIAKETLGKYKVVQNLTKGM